MIIYSDDGSLLRDNGNGLFELRTDYTKQYREIDNGRQLRSTLRSGQYAWPGGYQLAFIASDGDLLCFDCVRSELYSVLYSIRHKIGDGWRVIGCDIVYDYETECGDYCSHCSKQLSEPSSALNTGEIQ